MKIVVGDPCPLDECPVGLFKFGATLALMTEYAEMNDSEDPPYRQRDAYIVESGEYFWGGARTASERGDLTVYPCSIEAAD